MFVLHAVQLAMWVAVPALLVQAGLAKAGHWQVYLPAVLAVLRGHGRHCSRWSGAATCARVFLGADRPGAAGAGGPAAGGLRRIPALPVLARAAVPVLLRLQRAGGHASPAWLRAGAGRTARGAALGVYNTLQSLGLFAGGAVGGWLAKNVGSAGPVRA